MSQSFDIAVVGATGTVGETLVQILEERDFPVGDLHLLASSESAGHSVPFRGKNVRVREVDEFASRYAEGTGEHIDIDQ